MTEFKICFNPESEKVFRSLPIAIQSAIMGEQVEIHNMVKAVNPGCVATSGFRCPSYNSDLSGSLENSRHIWGCARDYRKNSIVQSQIPGLKTIVEKSCIHFEVEE